MHLCHCGANGPKSAEGARRCDMKSRPPVCPYCNRRARLVFGRELYPHIPEMSHRRFWRCEPCDAHVGTHNGTTQPFGRLADAPLRKMRMLAHAAFDPLWRTRRFQTRKHAYAWLAEQMGLSVNKCHIGDFNADQCRKVIEVCQTLPKSDQPAGCSINEVDGSDDAAHQPPNDWSDHDRITRHAGFNT
jgi:hypothetical protein